MTDARLPGRWVMDPLMDGLSDRAWRTFTGALMWSNEAGTDGLIPQTAMRFLHPRGVDGETLAELVDCNLFEPAGGAIQVCNWVDIGQELAEVITWRKGRNRERQQKWRDNQGKRQKPSVMDDVTRDITADVGQEQKTADRRQKTEEQASDAGDLENEKRVTEWPTVEIGKGRKAS